MATGAAVRSIVSASSAHVCHVTAGRASPVACVDTGRSGTDMAAEALHWHARVDDPQSERGPTTYRVFITTNVPAYSSSLTPIVSRRRYTEFCELRDCLAERQATEGVPCTLPLMPPKKLWSTAPGVVSTRCAVFEELLNAIGKDERLRLLPVVAAFVCAQARARVGTAFVPSLRSAAR